MSISAYRKIISISALVGLGLFLWICGGVLSPFMLGAVMAYGYKPAHRFWLSKNITPTLSALVLAICTYSIFVYFFIKIVPILGTLSSVLSEKFNVYREAFWTFSEPLIRGFFKETGAQIKESLDLVLRQSVHWLGSLAVYVFHNGWVFGQVMLTLALSPVVAFYLIKDGASIRRRVYGLVPVMYRSVVVLCVRDMDRALRQYFSGQVRVCGILMVYYAIFLGGLLSLPGALTMSVISGLLAFIPYLGFAISLFSACMIGVVESGQLPYVSSIALVYCGGNILESLILTPYLVGSRTGLHPLWVLLAVLVGGGLKGILGIILALPVATMGGACWRLLRKWYKNSLVYAEKS